MPEQNVVKCCASGKKGMLSCRKCLFEQIGANSAHIQAENIQNAPKMSKRIRLITLIFSEKW